MSDEEWKPMSIEEERITMYPDQYHIFESFGNSAQENELPQALLTESDFQSRYTNRQRIEVETNDATKEKIFFNTANDEDEYDEESMDIKEIKRNENEQIRSMRNIGILPTDNSYLDSRKTAPVFLGKSKIGRNRANNAGPPIILDDEFFQFDSTPIPRFSPNSSAAPTDESEKTKKNDTKTIYDVLKISSVPEPRAVAKQSKCEEFPALGTEPRKNRKKR